jgi:arsenate reductase (thioredoxin)
MKVLEEASICLSIPSLATQHRNSSNEIYCSLNRMRATRYNTASIFKHKTNETINMASQQVDPKSFYQELQNYLMARSNEFHLIPTERKSELETVAQYIYHRLKASSPAKLTFICTHNSRRSHLSQIWAQVTAEYYGLSGIETFSGGTEATAFNPRAVAAMKRCGFQIEASDPAASNPRYEVRFSNEAKPMTCFSKVFNSPPNPNTGYCAVMTCSQADEACPLVNGCDLRIPIRYEDPKAGDDTPQEASLYDERARQICREMLYLMSRVK